MAGSKKVGCFGNRPHMIFSDGVHLISDTSVQELHEYCAAIGIKRCWFHASSKHQHYDIPKLRRADFFQEHPEVKKVSSKQIVRLLRTLNL